MLKHAPVMDAGGARRRLPNLWDLCAFGLLFTTLILIFQGAREALAPIAVLQQDPISLDPARLPEYALRTTLRMLVALVASLAFTFAYGALAAKRQRAERVLVPLLDILQSVPILGFLSFTVVGFMSLFPGQLLGAELAAIFAIFTSQAWNMTFSFYQSLKTVPAELEEVAHSFHLTAWQRFWRLEVPFAMPGLVWNTMMSMSGGWFFVVASEAIAVGTTTVDLPGIGSYLALAIARQDLVAVGWAMLAMLVVIGLYDQLMFRPLVAWSDKFRVERSVGASAPRSWVLLAVRRTRLFGRLLGALAAAVRALSQRRLAWPARRPAAARRAVPSPAADRAWHALVLLAVLLMGWKIVAFVATGAGWADVGVALLLGGYTLVRVVVLVALSSLLWVPVGVWIGLRPRWAERVQPLAQFLAAFPANLMFPFVVLLIVRHSLAPDIWLSPLMVLGTQWYILFNVIAGASAFPSDLRDVAASFHVRGARWWFKVVLPGVFPYYVTGAITASGAAWNTAIVAELAHWGDITVRAHGLGAYIADATTAGDHPRIVLGIAVMSVLVLALNRVLWRPLYDLAMRRTRLE